jgi:hypothetical protein
MRRGIDLELVFQCIQALTCLAILPQTHLESTECRRHPNLYDDHRYPQYPSHRQCGTPAVTPSRYPPPTSPVPSHHLNPISASSPQRLSGVPHVAHPSPSTSPGALQCAFLGGRPRHPACLHLSSPRLPSVLCPLPLASSNTLLVVPGARDVIRPDAVRPPVRRSSSDNSTTDLRPEVDLMGGIMSTS